MDILHWDEAPHEVTPALDRSREHAGGMEDNDFEEARYIAEDIDGGLSDRLEQGTSC